MSVMQTPTGFGWWWGGRCGQVQGVGAAMLFAKEATMVQVWWVQTPRTNGYVIQRRIGTGEWAEVTRLEGGALAEWRDTEPEALLNGATVAYRVAGTNARGDGPFSEPATLTIPGPPDVVTGVGAQWID